MYFIFLSPIIKYDDNDSQTVLIRNVFCVKVFNADDQLNQYDNVLRMSSRQDVQFLSNWRSEGSFVELFEFKVIYFEFYGDHTIMALGSIYNDSLFLTCAPQLKPCLVLRRALSFIPLCTVDHWNLLAEE